MNWWAEEINGEMTMFSERWTGKMYENPFLKDRASEAALEMCKWIFKNKQSIIEEVDIPIEQLRLLRRYFGYGEQF